MRKKINIICYMLMAFLGIYLAIYQNSMNYITEGIANKSLVMGVLVALHFIGIMVGPITSGEIGDRIGKKKVLVVAFVVILIGISIVFLVGTITVIAIGIFLIGCGFGAIESLGSSILADSNPTDTNKAINISQIFFSVGAVLGPLVSLKIIEITENWKMSYLVAFLFFSIMLVIVSKTDFESLMKFKSTASQSKGELTGKLTCKSKGEPKEKGLYSAKLIKDKYFQLLCISIFLYVGIEGASSFWITTYFRDVLSVERLGSYVLSSFWGSMILGRYIGSKLGNKTRIGFNISLIISITSITIGLLIKTPISGIISFTLLGFGFSIIWPVLMSMAADRYPENTGTAMGMMMTCSAVGGIAIPFIMGVLGDTFSITAGLAVVPLSALLILVLQMKAAKL